MINVHVRIGPYESDHRLAVGGMSEVFLATDTRDQRRVALKVSRPGEPAMRETEARGAELQKQLSELDSRVPRVYEIGEDDGVLYVVMELVPGEDLSEVIERGPMGHREAIRVAGELCELLARAHSMPAIINGETIQGMVHGDIKPKNVRLDPSGAVKVLDFGIAKALTLSRRLTRNEFGSLAYSSPERLESGHVDAQSDLWSVGVVLYEMLTGQRPYRDENTQQLDRTIRSRPVPPTLPDDCPAAMNLVLRKALAPTLGARYKTADELLADLGAVGRGEAPLATWESAGPNVYEATRRTRPSGAAANDGEATRRTAASALAETAGDVTGRSAAGGVTARSAAAADAAAGDATVRSGAAAGSGRDAAPDTTITERSPKSGVHTIPSPAAGVAHPLVARVRRLVPWFWLVAIATGVLIVGNEYQAFGAADRLRTRLPSASRADADALWNRYLQVRRQSHLKVGAFGLHGPFKKWLVTEADALLADYRSDYPTIREKGWRDAVTLLRRARFIDSRDRKVEARLRYCQGHLARIDGQARKEDGKPVQARAHFNAAIGAFEDAARLWPRWSDPPLGLARTYFYGLEDFEKGQQAFTRAQELGHKAQNRDVEMIADGHRLRAEALWARLGAVSDLPQERQYLDWIRDACERALELYSEIPAYSQVNEGIRKVQELLDRVNAREQALLEIPT